MAKALAHCYGQRTQVSRVAATLVGMGALVTSGWVVVPSPVVSEVAVILSPPAWPSGEAALVEERTALGGMRSSELVDVVARRGLEAFLRGEEQSICPLGGSIRVACRENGNPPVLSAEVARCRLPLRRNEEASMTGEFTLVLPDGMPCRGPSPQACLAARVQSARLWATVSDRQGSVVTAAEVNQEVGSGGWLIPCSAETEASLPAKDAPQ